jgi:hypothetical protein
VECEDGIVGNVVGFDVDEYTAEIMALIVVVKALGKRAAVPMPWTRSIRSGKVQLQCRRADVESLI